MGGWGKESKLAIPTSFISQFLNKNQSLLVNVFSKPAFNILPNFNSMGADLVRDGILEDVRQNRMVASDVLTKFPLSGGKSLRFWKFLQEPIYDPSPDLSIYDAKKVAFYNFSSRLFFCEE